MAEGLSAMRVFYSQKIFLAALRIYCIALPFKEVFYACKFDKYK